MESYFGRERPEDAQMEKVLKLRESDPAAYAALPLRLRDHAQIYADLRRIHRSDYGDAA